MMFKQSVPAPHPHVVPSEYAPYGCVVEPTSYAPQTTPKNVKADRITYRELLAAMRWSAEDFERAQVFGFPRAVSALFDRRGGRESIYMRSQIAEWKASIKRLAATL